MAKCASEVIDPISRESREGRGESLSCTAPARFKLNGVLLCRRHAQTYAFEALLANEPVQLEELSRPRKLAPLSALKADTP